MEKKSNGLIQAVLWIVIVAALYFNFLIGIPLLLIKLHTDKKNMLLNAKVTMVIGWIIFIAGAVCIPLWLTGNFTAEDGSNMLGGVIILVVVLCGGGLAIILDAKKCKKLALMYHRYVPAFVSSANSSIDEVSESLGESYDMVEDNVQKLINSKMLKDSYIDKARRSLVSPALDDLRITRKAANGGSDMEESKPLMMEVECPNCGGITAAFEGEEVVCEYCGSKVQQAQRA